MSEQDCRNDCVLPISFPRRPGTLAASLHPKECSCGCGAADGVSADNRPALNHFNYRIGTYGSIREFLFHQLNKTPELGNWTHREADDPAVALIEGAAILGDILTFYQETYANEAYLRTANWRESIADLVRLLGYRLSPPVGGKATFAFELKKDEPVTIPAGFPVKAPLEDFPKPADFETLEEITAYPWLNRFNLFRPLEKRDIVDSTTEFYISAPNQLLNPIAVVAGDRLMIGESNKNELNQPTRLENAEIVIVESVRELHGAKIFKIKGKLKRTANIESLVAYKIGRTFHHFGHNSPDTIVDESKPVTSTATVTETTSTSTSTIPKIYVPKYRPVDETLISKAVDMRFGPNEFPLDTDVGPFPNNVPVIIQAGIAESGLIPLSWHRPAHRTFVATVKSHQTITAKWGAISGTVTQLNLESALSSSETDNEGLLNQARQTLTGANATLQTRKQELDAALAKLEQDKSTLLSNQKAEAKTKQLLADTKAKALAASADAATLKVARELAATALKDGALDIAAQEVGRHVAQTMQFVADAKNTGQSILSQAQTNADRVDAERGSATTARNRYQVLTIPDPIAVALSLAGSNAAQAVLSSVNFTELKNQAVAIKSLAQPLVDGLADAVRAGSLLETAVDVLIEAARQDADALERFEKAKEAADRADQFVIRMEDLVVSVTDQADTAANNVVSAEAMVKSSENDLLNKWNRYLQAVEDVEFAAQAVNVRMYIGDALFYEVLSPLFRIERPRIEITLETPDLLNFYGTAEEVGTLKGRRLMFVKPGADPFVLSVNKIPDFIDESTAAFKQLHQIGLSDKVNYDDFPNENPFVTVFGNLVDADEGKTLPETPIGSGDAKQIFQNFKLPKAPLTYHLVSENTPSETPELVVYVDGREWRAVDSFFGRGKDEQVYIVREDADGNSWVQFGDGKTGARLSTGANNVTALYRIGDGAFGPLKPDTKVQPSAKIKNLDKIGMPSVATGGAPAEDGENARNAAPGKVQSLGRIVSLRDFEAEAAAIPGVAAATASWQLFEDIPVVQIVVLMETGRAKEKQSVENTINAYNKDRGAGRDPVRVVLGGRGFVTARVEYGLREGYRADLVEPEIRRALGVNFGKATRDEDQTGLFSVRRRRFGGAEYASSIEAWVQNVEGVVWARVTSFQKMAEADSPAFNADDPETYAVPDDNLEKVVACDSVNVLSLYDKHLFLTAKEATG